MKKLAIIGTGVAGMGAAYFLKDYYDITFFEKNNYAGGHSNTVWIPEEDYEIPIDTAFLVFNEKNYPNFSRLLRALRVEAMDTSMSFSVQHKLSGLEYKGTGLANLFVQKRNILNFKFMKMIGEIDRFRRVSEVVLEENNSEVSLEDFLHENKFSSDFYEKFLIPMSSAVWSTPRDLMLKFPALTLIRFFQNHGFLGLKTQHQWRTVKGGSCNYRNKIMDMFKKKVHLDSPVQKVFKKKNAVVVRDHEGSEATFDRVVIASHADQALDMLEDPSDKQRSLLSKFKYQKNKTLLHTDQSVMPRIRKAWASWNYRITKGQDGQMNASTIYYMNELQKVSDKKDYFISIDDNGEVDPNKVLWETMYEHPIFNVETIEAQKQLPELNQSSRILFCGSYFKYGFHEDAFTSALEMARSLTGHNLWN